MTGMHFSNNIMMNFSWNGKCDRQKFVDKLKTYI